MDKDIPTFQITVQCTKDTDLEVEAEVRDINGQFRCLDIAVHHPGPNASSGIKFFLPVEDDEVLKAIVTGILDSTPRLRSWVRAAYLINYDED